MTEEERLLYQCLQGEQTAQRRLYDLYSKKMMGVCYRYARSLAEAEDMLQDAFVKVFDQLSEFRNEGSFEGWIRRIVVNTAIDHRKKENRKATTVDLEEAIEVSIDHLSFLENKDLILLLRQLPEESQLIINLYAIEGYTHQEISRMLGIKESSSRSRLTRARASFRELMEKASKKNEKSCLKKTSSIY